MVSAISPRRRTIVTIALVALVALLARTLVMFSELPTSDSDPGVVDR